MKTKQRVKLIYVSPLWLVSNGIRYSHYNHHLSDSEFIGLDPWDWNKEIKITKEEWVKQLTPTKVEIGSKDFDLVKRIGLKMKHESVLEFTQLVFDVKLSTKALLEESRHRIAISKTVTSSRYALKKINIEMEPTDDEDIDYDLDVIRRMIKRRLIQNKPLDKVSKMLPQAFIYYMQWQFNLRSLLHFLRLRLTKEAHRDIRLIAKMVVDELPEEYRELVLLDEHIRRNYEE
jgi:thymidylate synthase (FAD)